jgi:hypothetical protein
VSNSYINRRDGPDMKCQQNRRNAGLVYPRTCENCGLGPCRYHRKPPLPTAETMAAEIAETIIPGTGIGQPQVRANLTALLIAFAKEIKRSAIEP